MELQTFARVIEQIVVQKHATAARLKHFLVEFRCAIITCLIKSNRERVSARAIAYHLQLGLH